MRAMLGSAGLAAALLLAGCAAEPELTAEEARKALIEMLERPGEDVGWLERLSADLEEPAEDKGEGKVEIGRWRCDLKEKTFRADVHFPKAHYHRHNFYRGEFRWTRNGWRAEVTGGESLHGGPR
jgi:hypothetical protein